METPVRDPRRGAHVALAGMSILLIVAGLTLLLEGCAATRTGGSSLSDASERARQTSRGHRDRDHHRSRDSERRRDRDRDSHRDRDREPLRQGRRVSEPPGYGPDAVVIVEDPGYGESGFRERNQPAAHPVHWFGGVTAGVAGAREDGPYTRPSVGLVAGLFEPGSAGRVAFQIEAAASGVQNPEPWTTGGFEHQAEFSLGGAVRYDLASERAPTGLFVLGGLRAGILRWDYRNPVEIEDGYGDVTRVRDDFVNTWTPYAGIGVALLRNQEAQVAAHLDTGYKFTSGHSYRGLRNDLFSGYPFVEFRLDLTQHVR